MVTGTVVGNPTVGRTGSGACAASILLRLRMDKAFVVRVNGYDALAERLADLRDGDRVMLHGELMTRFTPATGTNVIELKLLAVAKLMHGGCP